MFTQGQQTSLTEKNMHVGNEYTFTQKFKHSDKLVLIFNLKLHEPIKEK